MYSFAQREDTLVVDEPFYAHYLSKSDAKDYHPGAHDIMESQPNDGQEVIEMILGNHPKPVVFFKNMTHHMLNLDFKFVQHVTNIILTRNPVEMLPSFAKVIANPTMKDVGYDLHSQLLDHLIENDNPPIVVDSKQILLNPEQALKTICQKLEIPFDSNMLKWKKGPIPEDGIWAKYWYKTVHNSTEFATYKPKADDFPKNLLPLLNECQPHYHKIMKLSI
jgi:hypothetical protein